MSSGSFAIYTLIWIINNETLYNLWVRQTKGHSSTNEAVPLKVQFAIVIFFLTGKQSDVLDV